MVIGIDGNEANISTRVGVGQYSYQILKELSKLPTQHRFIIFLKSPPLPDMPSSDTHWQYKIIGPQKFWTRFAVPLHLFLYRPVNIFYSPSHYSPFPCFIPTIPTIHDIGYLQNLHQFSKKDIYQLVNWTKDSINQSEHIIAVSEFTKNELHKTYHLNLKKISVCYNGVEEPPKIIQSDFTQIKSKFKITSPYFLSVGTLKPNKNYPFLISSMVNFPGYQLVIAGKKGWIYQEIFQTVTKLKLEKQIIFTDFITEKEKWTLYKNAICTIIPSTYEGFGIPTIESQKIGTPVIASNIPSLKEVLANSALYINPNDQKTLIKAITEIQKADIRTSLIKKGLAQSAKYTWTDSASNLLTVFDSLHL